PLCLSFVFCAIGLLFKLVMKGLKRHEPAEYLLYFFYGSGNVFSVQFDIKRPQVIVGIFGQQQRFDLLPQRGEMVIFYYADHFHGLVLPLEVHFLAYGGRPARFSDKSFIYDNRLSRISAEFLGKIPSLNDGNFQCGQEIIIDAYIAKSDGVFIDLGDGSVVVSIKSSHRLDAGAALQFLLDDRYIKCVVPSWNGFKTHQVIVIIPQVFVRQEIELGIDNDGADEKNNGEA